MGPMQCMVTITQNDNCPETLAAIRRGPFAAPTEEERIEYLLGVKTGGGRPRFEDYSLEHVLSFQRRVHAAKANFLRRGHTTPLGRLCDWWDRTEAQARAALHSHILGWFERRENPAEKDDDYKILPPVPRTSPGVTSKQRPPDQKAEGLPRVQHDDPYHHFAIGHANAEMIRPWLNPDAGWNNFDVSLLRIAGLGRTIQTKLYMHNCSPKYCLQGRSTCRFGNN